MPNRILRDWTDSEVIDKLSVNAERFFTRLIMKVDDYGIFPANAQLLKSSLFPLKADIRNTDISLWIAECKKCGLLTTYLIAQKEYLQINNFKQTLRQKKQKYPPPVTCLAYDTHVISECNASAPLKRNETETETKQKFRLRGKSISNSIKDYFLENNSIFLDRWPDKKTVAKILEKMEVDYAGYDFTNDNHLRNAFKTTFEKLKDEQAVEVKNGSKIITHEKNYVTD